MDVKGVGIMFALCSVMVDISYAGQERTVEVSDFVCNRTYILSQNDRIVLTFMPDGPFDDELTFTRCVFTIINNSTSRSMCITNHGMGTSFYRQMDICRKVFKYFIGYLPFHMLNAYSCSDFKRKPMCTSRSKVYAVFENAHAFAIYPVSVKLYVQDWVVTTTTTRSTAAYWFSNDDDDDDDDLFGYNHERLMNIAKGVIGAFIVLFLCVLCCICLRSKHSGCTGRTIQNTHSPRMPTYTPDTRSPDMPTYTEEAPPYSEVMQQQRLYSYEEDRHWQIHDPVYQVARPDAASAFPIPENQPLRKNQPPITDYTFRNQPTSTAPPPDYSDLKPPPPHPGY